MTGLVWTFDSLRVAFSALLLETSRRKYSVTSVEVKGKSIEEKEQLRVGVILPYYGMPGPPYLSNFVLVCPKC